MKNSAPNSAQSELSTNSQALDLDLSTNELEPKSEGGQAHDRAGNAESTSRIVPVTEDFVRLLNPKSIRISSMPNRAPDADEDISFDELCASIFGAKRNTQPIHVRALSSDEMRADPTQKYELISGERRLCACIACEVGVRAIVMEAPQSGTFGMDALIENMHRKDLSAFEFGRQILHVLKTDGGTSLRRLALKLGRDVSILSRAKDIASLPDEVISAFASSSDIRYCDAKPLSDAVKTGGAEASMEAIRISREQLSLKPEEIVGLLAAAAKRKSKLRRPQKLVTDFEGKRPVQAGMSRALKCSDQDVGAWKIDKQGRVQVNLAVSLSAEQQAALASQIEGFIQRRVLRIAAAKKTFKQDVAHDGLGNVDDTAISTLQEMASTGGVA